MEGLALFTDDQLIEELKRRYEKGLVFAGLKAKEGSRVHEADQIFNMDFQCLTASIGLVEQVKCVLMNIAMNRTIKVVDDEEEDDEED